MESIKERIHDDFSKLRNDKSKYFDSFYSNNYNLVYRICFSILKNKENSEDATQTVFEKIYNMPNEKIASECESTWLYTVAKNEALQFIRKNKYNISFDDELYEIEDSESQIDSIVENEEYNNLVKQLDKKQEQIVSLKVLSDFTFKEIGQLLSMPTATVQWYYYKSIKFLRLAVGNLAMLIIAMFVGLRYIFKKKEVFKSKKDKKANYSEMSSSEEETAADMNTYNKKEVTKNISIDLNTISSNTVESSAIDSLNFKEMPWREIGIFSITGIFLTCTIIFSILCYKHRRKKVK